METSQALPSGGTAAVETPPAPASVTARAARLSHRLGVSSTVQRVLPWALPAVLLVAVPARTYSRSVLWLDEAQSVAIARLALPDMVGALRTDGAPPLYYLLLHGWMSLFGTGPLAVRTLSTLVSWLALPAAYLAGRAWRDAQTGRIAVLVLAVSPFAVRYATEARMYELLILLGLLLLWALPGAVRSPTRPRLAALAALGGLLALTHYWALFLLATVVGTLAWQRRFRPAAGVVAGAVLFAPWLPVFAFQVGHTGTPWASPPSVTALFDAGRQWAGGSGVPATALFVVALVLTLVAVLGQRTPGGVLLTWPPSRTGVLLLVGSAGTLLVGVLTSQLLGSGFPVRYSAAAFAPGVLLVAVGARRLPRAARLVVLAGVAGLGLAGSVGQPLQDNRTEAGVIAGVLRSRLQPGDLVLYCPDQLGPAVSRLLPPRTAGAVYPTLGRADRVDWVDYKRRQAMADPSAIARTVHARAGGAVWLVSQPGYRTFGSQCQQLGSALGGLRGPGTVVQRALSRYAERSSLTRFPPPR